MCDDLMSPSYYIMGWQCVHRDDQVREVFGPMHCMGAGNQSNACSIAHRHISLTESNYASTMWLFKIGLDGVPHVAIGKQQKNGYIILMGIGGKGDDDSEAWEPLKLGLRETMLIIAQREGHEEVGDVFAAECWVLSWLGSGSLHDKD